MKLCFHPWSLVPSPPSCVSLLVVRRRSRFQLQLERGCLQVQWKHLLGMVWPWWLILLIANINELKTGLDCVVWDWGIRRTMEKWFWFVAAKASWLYFYTKLSICSNYDASRPKNLFADQQKDITWNSANLFKSSKICNCRMLRICRNKGHYLVSE